MTVMTHTPAASTQKALDRLEALALYQEHMLSEAAELADAAAGNCAGFPRSLIGRTAASIQIADNFRREMIELIEGLQLASRSH